MKRDGWTPAFGMSECLVTAGPLLLRMTGSWNREQSFTTGAWAGGIQLLSSCCTSLLTHEGFPYHLRGSLNRAEARPRGVPQCGECTAVWDDMKGVEAVNFVFGPDEDFDHGVVEEWLDRVEPASPLALSLTSSLLRDWATGEILALLEDLDPDEPIDWSKETSKKSRF